MPVICYRRILELGSGLGFLGLVLCTSCSPSEMMFTDCHSNVINVLVENIERNLTHNANGINLLSILY